MIHPTTLDPLSLSATSADRISRESDPLIRILFLVIASLGLLTAVGTVVARNLVHAALFLVGFFFLVACTFVLLEAEFMAAMQVLVYIGAVAIILMFGIMLTRNIQGDETTGGHWMRKLPAGVIAFGLLAMLATGIAREQGLGGNPAWSILAQRPKFVPPDPDAPPTDGRSAAIANMGKAVGDEMLRRFVIPFEVAGLLLTAALVGAIALAKSDEKDPHFRLGAAQTGRGGTEGPASPDPTNGHAVAGTLAGAKLSPETPDRGQA